jgi:hypothetical protein
MKINSKLMGFAAGTKVLMADGKEKAIEDINAGDVVLSFNQLDAFGVLEPKKVLNTYKRLDRNPLKVKVHNSDIELTVAEGQLFINPGSDWKNATNINEIIDGEGNVHKFDVSRISRGKHAIYDIIVEDNHSLIANGVRVHNMTYSIADVIAGRNLAGSDIQSGPIGNYNYRGDYDNNNRNYSQGNSKKKKSNKRKNIKPEPKIDGLQAGAKLLSSIEDLTDLLSEIIDETTPANLTILKLVVQQSVDNIVNYLASFGASILNATMSAYDKSEILVMTADMTQAAVAMRKPFEETVVSASGKLIAATQLKLFELQIARMNGILETYLGPAEADEKLFDVNRDGQDVSGSKSRKNANSRSNDGRYGSSGGNNRSSGGSSGNNRSIGKTTGGGPAPAKNTKVGGPTQKVKSPAGPSKAPTPTARPQGLSRPVGSPSNLRSDSAAGLRAGGGVQSPNQTGPNKGLGSVGSTAKTGMASQGASYSGPASAGAAQKAQAQSRATANARAAATSSATRNSSNFCFAYGTMFKMADGSLKAIQDIQVGDNMLLGGRVTTTMISDGMLEDWYIYNGVKLTGSHPVLDRDGVWKKVYETDIAIPTTQEELNYILINENHKMISHNGEIFTDYFMVGMENQIRAEMYHRDFDNMFRILNNQPVMRES